jgi:hypothetical protein
MSVPQAAAIVDRLSDAGLPAGAIHQWFSHPRRELGGLTPHLALELGSRLAERPAGQVVLDLAERDIEEGGWRRAA